MDEPGPGVAALLAGAASFLFVLVESALEHHSAPRLLEVAREKDREGPFDAFLRSDQPYLHTFQLLSLGAHAALVLAIYAWVQSVSGGPHHWVLVKAGIFSTLALLTVGRSVPLILGRLFPERVLLHLRPFVTAAHRVFSPLTFLLVAVTTVTERIAGRSEAKNGHEDLEQEILSALEEGEMEGIIREEEADLIERALHLRDADVADCMTPRTSMFALPVGTPLREAMRQVSEAGHSRVPVYDENRDEIVGILYAKDVLAHWSTQESEDPALSEIVRRPFFVPETKRISKLLDEFKRLKIHLAIVIDEYGGTAGLVTIEDILEEIVGEIEDEYDESGGVPALDMIGDREAEVDGQIHVDDLGDALEVEIPSDEFGTVGGLVSTFLGRIPRTGEEFDYVGLHFTVLEADDRRVSRVRVEKPS